MGARRERTRRIVTVEIAPQDEHYFLEEIRTLIRRRQRSGNERAQSALAAAEVSEEGIVPCVPGCHVSRFIDGKSDFLTDNFRHAIRRGDRHEPVAILAQRVFFPTSMTCQAAITFIITRKGAIIIPPFLCGRLA